MNLTSMFSSKKAAPVEEQTREKTNLDVMPEIYFNAILSVFDEVTGEETPQCIATEVLGFGFFFIEKSPGCWSIDLPEHTRPTCVHLPTITPGNPKVIMTENKGSQNSCLYTHLPFAPENFEINLKYEIGRPGADGIGINIGDANYIKDRIVRNEGPIGDPHVWEYTNYGGKDAFQFGISEFHTKGYLYVNGMTRYEGAGQKKDRTGTNRTSHVPLYTAGVYHISIRVENRMLKFATLCTEKGQRMLHFFNVELVNYQPTENFALYIGCRTGGGCTSHAISDVSMTLW